MEGLTVTVEPTGDELAIRAGVTVTRPVEEIFHFWRNPANLPFFLDWLERVEPVDRHRSRWYIAGDGGPAESWVVTQADEGAPGPLTYELRGPNGRRMTLAIELEPLDGGDATQLGLYLRLGAADARGGLVGPNTAERVARDLARFAKLMEPR
jgi:hypothetical protein